MSISSPLRFLASKQFGLFAALAFFAGLPLGCIHGHQKPEHAWEEIRAAEQVGTPERAVAGPHYFYAVVRVARFIDDDPELEVHIESIVRTLSAAECERVLDVELTREEGLTSLGCKQDDPYYGQLFASLKPIGQYYILTKIEGEYSRAAIFEDRIRATDIDQEEREEMFRWMVDEILEYFEDQGMRATMRMFAPERELEFD